MGVTPPSSLSRRSAASSSGDATARRIKIGRPFEHDDEGIPAGTIVGDSKPSASTERPSLRGSARRSPREAGRAFAAAAIRQAGG